MSCPLRDIFGKPGAGVHAPRIFGLAAVDVFGTIALALAFGHKSVIAFARALAVWMIAAIILHRLFCVDTALNVFLFGKH